MSPLSGVLTRWHKVCFILFAIQCAIELCQPTAVLASDCALADEALRAQVGGQVSLLVGHKRVQLEIARTEAQRERGLMYRRVLAPGHGMVFLYDADAEHRFWMKNTYLHLDLVFLRSDGTITRIVHDLLPGANHPEWDLPEVGGEGCVVLELPAGETGVDGIGAVGRLNFRRRP